MQLKHLIIIFSIFPLSLNGFAKSNSRLVASLEDVLKTYSGSYKLEIGEVDVCPDGQFTAGEHSFVVGSSFKVANINKGLIRYPKEGECGSETNAKFDGKQLTYTLTEKCDRGTTTSTSYVFDFYTQENTRYVKMTYVKNYELKPGKMVSSSNMCVYSMELNKK